MEQTLTIDGMSCGHCVRAVEEALSALEDVQVVKVEIGRAVVEAGPGAVGKEVFSAAIEEEGFQLTAVTPGR